MRSASSCRAAEAELKQQKITCASWALVRKWPRTVATAIAGRAIGRKAVDARGDRREGDRAQAVRFGQCQRAGVSVGQQPLLVGIAALPDRPDRVDDVPGLQPVAARDLGLAGLAAAERAAFGEQLRPGGAMDGAVHAPAAEQGRLGRVDDGVHVEAGDVGLQDLDPVRHASSSSSAAAYTASNRAATPNPPMAPWVTAPNCTRGAAGPWPCA